MQTLCLSANEPNTAAVAAGIIRDGGLVAIPTETVYGLGANGLDEKAVAQIFEVKGRPQDNPLILHVADKEQIGLLCKDIPEEAYQLADAFWPGPLTMVLPARDIVPKRTTGGLSTVAVRCPDSEITRDIIRLAGVPLAAPSANISGKPSTTTAQHVLHDHDGKIPLVVDGGPCRVGVESTIVDLTERPARLLRPGGISPEALREILGDLIIDKAVIAQIDHDAVVKAPGMKYRHYAPQEPIIIVSGNREAAATYIRAHFEKGDRVLCFEEELPLYEGCAPLSYGQEANVDTLCAGLFAALRELDDPKIHQVYARCPEGGGIAYAVQNRLKKSSRLPHRQRGGKPMIIGITGGSGCGKTTVLQVLENLSFLTLDCDAIYHRLLREDPALLDSIEARFPGTVEQNKLQRKKLGDLVFSDPEALEDLNRITHGAVKKEVLRLLSAHKGHAAIDAIGLFEGELAQLCDCTVAVLAPREDRVQRLMARDGITREYAEKRIDAQHSDAWFRERCTYVLENSGNLDAFATNCLAFFRSMGIMEL